jgi:hypothetical protein
MVQHDDERDDQQVGGAWEAAGLGSRQDYAKLRDATNTIQEGGVLDDPDLEWLVAMLESTSEPVVRSKVMVMLAAAQPGTFPQKYRERLSAVITLHLNSENTLDKLSAAHLRQALSAGQGSGVG